MADAALRETPKDAHLWTLRGIASQKGGKLEEATKSFETALNFSPNYLPALEGAAETNYKSGSDKAELYLNRIVALKPEDPTAHAMLGAMAYRQHDCTRAVSHFDRAKTAISPNSDALGQYGICLIIEDRAKDAVPVLTTALGLSANDSRMRLALANAQYDSDSPREAIQTLEPLLAARPSEPDALSLAASAYEALGDTPKAVELLRNAILASPKSQQLYLDFAILCFNHSSFGVGVEMINAGLTQLPDSAPLYLARGVLNVQRARYPEAEADFAKANEIDPQQDIASLAHGLALVQQDKLDMALATAREELKKHPEDAFVRYLVAEILEQKGAIPGTPEFQQAIREAEQAVKTRPDFVLAHDILAGLYLKSSQIELAKRHAREALRLQPTDQVALYHLVQALRKSGDKQELPELVKRLSELRKESREEEAQKNHYKIFEMKPEP
jgi:tetratricopeptide (TPR) repeat protein